MVVNPVGDQSCKNNLYLSSYYGWRADPFDPSKTEFHDGVDVAKDGGCKILSALKGDASHIWWAGITVEVVHNNVYTTRYGHGSKYLSNAGSVNTGQEIMYMGSTGNSTGDHLHFTVYESGEDIDPFIHFGQFFSLLPVI